MDRFNRKMAVALCDDVHGSGLEGKPMIEVGGYDYSGVVN
jgi:hypothetical protein